MPAFIIRFIVLGEIPGTNLAISFWMMVFGLVFLLTLYLAVSKFDIPLRLARAINPFVGSQNQIDLISV